MKVLKLVFGVLCCVFCAFVMFQSCAAGLGNALSGSQEISGTAGMLVALFMLAGGIIMLSTRKSEKKGGSIACIIIFLIGALVGFGNAGSYADLKIWSGFLVLLAFINLLATLKRKKIKVAGDE